MAMPLRLIYNVKVSLRQKLGLVCVFGLCFVMIAFAIIRAKQVLVQQQFVNLKMLMIWSTLTAAICRFLPTLRQAGALGYMVSANHSSQPSLLAVSPHSRPSSITAPRHSTRSTVPGAA